MRILFPTEKIFAPRIAAHEGLGSAMRPSAIMASPAEAAIQPLDVLTLAAMPPPRQSHGRVQFGDKKCIFRSPARAHEGFAYFADFGRADNRVSSPLRRESCTSVDLFPQTLAVSISIRHKSR